LSKNAIGLVTDVEAVVSEIFSCKGLIITEENWLKVFPFEKWHANKIPTFTVG